MHQLLEGQIPIHVNQFFRWRNSGGRTQGEEIPHCIHPELSRKYGLVVDIDWTFYLRQGRPLRAWKAIQADAPAEDVRSLYPFAIQAIALEDPWNHSLCMASVFLIEALGYDSHPLRITLAVLDRVAVAQVVGWIFYVPVTIRCVTGDVVVVVVVVNSRRMRIRQG